MGRRTCMIGRFERSRQSQGRSGGNYFIQWSKRVHPNLTSPKWCGRAPLIAGRPPGTPLCHEGPIRGETAARRSLEHLTSEQAKKVRRAEQTARPLLQEPPVNQVPAL